MPEEQEPVSYKLPLQMIQFVCFARGHRLDGASGKAWYQPLQLLLALRL